MMVGPVDRKIFRPADLVNEGETGVFACCHPLSIMIEGPVAMNTTQPLIQNQEDDVDEPSGMVEAG